MTKQTGTREVLPACLSHRCGTGWDDEETDQISVLQLQLQHDLRRTDSFLQFPRCNRPAGYYGTSVDKSETTAVCGDPISPCVYRDGKESYY
jgi:hypothetical protein